eukprot:TRINITY_DN34325_c0_g1_i1.p1 TRINITY_DN34325_c0_g1~~TRINITY_DN34325_c0_g1_i1.p1  ORF type:complete len:212 (-),score=31.50 TRINITY_DN34325_c0_g1_i1:767-1402(-)
MKSGQFLADHPVPDGILSTDLCTYSSELPVFNCHHRGRVIAAGFLDAGTPGYLGPRHRAQIGLGVEAASSNGIAADFDHRCSSLQGRGYPFAARSVTSFKDKNPVHRDADGVPRDQNGVIYCCNTQGSKGFFQPCNSDKCPEVDPRFSKKVSQKPSAAAKAAAAAKIGKKAAAIEKEMKDETTKTGVLETQLGAVTKKQYPGEPPYSPLFF